ncbi:MAG: DNA polymerase I [Eubacteriales bacterium]
MKEKIVLIDGHSILNRAFYGVPDLTNYEGLHTNAIYGFLNILFKILEEEQPQYLAVAFDLKAPTFRHKLYDQYKGTRKGMPEELREQVPLMKEVLTAMGIAIVSKEGYEADDVLGTLATCYEADGCAVTLVSGDRDLLQIASKEIKIKIPKTKGGKTESYDYYEEDVWNEYHLTTKQFIELKALMGDAADNIPGVPKVGLKTATGLLETYGTIANIYDHIEEITKKSIQGSLRENRDLAELSKELATIKIDCELPDIKESARITNFYTKEAYDQFKRLGFKNYLSRFDQEDKFQEETETAIEVEQVSTKKRVMELYSMAKEQDKVAIYLLCKEQVQNGIVAIALAWEVGKVYVIGTCTDLDDTDILETTRAFLMDLQEEKKGRSIVTFEAKKLYEYLSLERSHGIYDLQIGAYLVNPLKNDYEIEDVVHEYLGKNMQTKVERIGKKKWCDVYEEHKGEEDAPAVLYAGEAALGCFETYELVRNRLQELEMERLMDELEMPLSYVLYKMQQEGILVEKDALQQYGEELVGRIVELEEGIYEASGTTFNINSPKQLGQVLFEKMELPGGKKTKTGYSTSAEVLDKLAGEYPIVSQVLEYRALTKLKSTYAEGLANCIQEDGRIHSHFNQTITATGRISSTEPNLQNIPMRMELGRRIRKVFIPKEGYVFMDADYSQIELRILAHMSKDETLIQAYRENEDIHRLTASQVFHTPFEEVTELQRRNAKAVNFGIIYGISAFGLSQDLSITPKEAGKYREQYFATYPKVKEFLDELIDVAKKDGAIATLLGRRRPVPEIHSSNFMQRSFGERIAMNSPIQGTAADIIKIAMLRVYEALKELGLQSRLILQIHDELLLEVAQEEVEQVAIILEREMKGAMELAVSLEIESHTGSNWYDVK